MLFFIFVIKSTVSIKSFDNLLKSCKIFRTVLCKPHLDSTFLLCWYSLSDNRGPNPLYFYPRSDRQREQFAYLLMHILPHFTQESLAGWILFVIYGVKTSKSLLKSISFFLVSGLYHSVVITENCEDPISEKAFRYGNFYSNSHNIICSVPKNIRIGEIFASLFVRLVFRCHLTHNARKTSAECF